MLRTANFNDGQAQGVAADSGTWTVTGGRYQVAPEAQGGDAVSVFYVDTQLNSYFELQATVRAVRPTAGFKGNGYLIFDYQSKTDFKFAGIDISTNKLVMGRRTASGWITDVQSNARLRADADYNMLLALNGTTATLAVNNQNTLTHTFQPRVIQGINYGLNTGMVGIRADNARAQIDNVTVQQLAPVTTLERKVDFSAGPTSLFQPPLSGQWQTTNGRYDATATTTPAVDLIGLQVSPNSLIELNTILRTSGSGGFIFDQYSATDYKFVTIENGRVVVGHRTDKGGMVIDSTFNTNIVSGTDYQLGVMLKGSTVSISLNGQFLLSYAFNALVTNGGFGLLSQSGLTSFDAVTVRTDDPNYKLI